MPDQAELHDILAAEVVTLIVKTVLESGGKWSDVMVVTESVLVGIALAGVRFGRDDAMLDKMVGNARQRLAEIRLTGIQVAGHG